MITLIVSREDTQDDRVNILNFEVEGSRAIFQTCYESKGKL